MKRTIFILSFFIFALTYKIFANPPVIESIYPDFGYVETNNSITITGKYFDANCEIFIIPKDVFDSPSRNKNGVESAAFISSKKLEVKTKDNLEEGNYYIKIVNSSDEFVTYKKEYKIISKRSGPPNQPPLLELTATPVYGNAPLSVTFGLTSKDDGSIISYEWDFEGKGNWAESRRTAYTYTNPGGYVAKVRVVDSDGARSETQINITVLNNGSSDNLQPAVANTRSGPVNQLPILELIAEPVSGTAPLNVTLTIIGNDPDGSILNYEWDFEGKGDWNKTTYSNLNMHKVNYTYINPGNYNAKVRAIDNDHGRAQTMININVLGNNEQRLNSDLSKPKK